MMKSTVRLRCGVLTKKLTQARRNALKVGKYDGRFASALAGADKVGAPSNRYQHGLQIFAARA